MEEMIYHIFHWIIMTAIPTCTIIFGYLKLLKPYLDTILKKNNDKIFMVFLREKIIEIVKESNEYETLTLSKYNLIKELYKEYKNLGGNGEVEKIVNEILKNKGVGKIEI